MDDEVYWYYINGKLRQHISPPKDPSSTSFAIIRTTDIGMKRVEVEVTLCIEGNYSKPIFFTSSPNQPPKYLRERIENYVKESLKHHRSITDWTSSERKKKPVKSKIKRRK